MSITDLSFYLTDEQKAIQEGARKFFMEVWRPAAIELDRLPDPSDVIAKNSILWDVMRESYRLGYHKLGFPENFGGLGADALTCAIVDEEKGYASVDFGVAVGTSIWPYLGGLAFDVPELKDLTRRFCADTRAELIGCWAITEPEHGSDWFLFGKDYCKDKKPSPQVSVVKKKDEYVMNGQKSAWISNGTIATHALVFFGSRADSGMEDGGLAVVPLDLKGITRGKPLNKLGQRALNQGEIFFDDVHLPACYVVACSDPAAYQKMHHDVLSGANMGMGRMFAGLARAALDEALEYTKQRVQGGRALFHHQSVKLALYDMFVEVEAARYLSRSTSVYNGNAEANGQPHSLQHSIASKIFSTRTAYSVASRALQLFGGYGLSKDFHIEKIFRDARAATIEDGVNEVLAIHAADLL
jgi:alkylation response protein AidB-like acyl-CoA dehydrogenase